jgi:hypothetical protein
MGKNPSLFWAGLQNTSRGFTLWSRFLTNKNQHGICHSEAVSNPEDVSAAAACLDNLCSNADFIRFRLSDCLH